jgi:hypothetical protein
MYAPHMWARQVPVTTGARIVGLKWLGDKKPKQVKVSNRKKDIEVMAVLLAMDED